MNEEQRQIWLAVYMAAFSLSSSAEMAARTARAAVMSFRELDLQLGAQHREGVK